MARKKTDPTTAAALEIVNMEKLQETSVLEQQKQRENMIAECGKAIGRVQTSNMFAKFATVSSLVWLKQVKSQKIYRDIPGVGSWEKFCDSVGMSRAKVDEDLQNLAAFGEDFLLTCQQFSLGYRDLRKLRQLNHDGSVEIQDNLIVIGDESIPLDSDHHEDLQAAIERMLDDKNEQLEEAATTLRTKDRLLESKEQVINKQEREIFQHEARAKQQGFAPGEEAFFKQLEADQLVIDGILQKYSFDPEELRTDLTPRMAAAATESLGYLRKVTVATHKALVDLLEIEAEPWDGAAVLAEFDAEKPGKKSTLSDAEISGISEGIL
ncbi:MAG: hypothetical protein L3J57_14620 [Desulfuromusa sp.]|nr:hypothetical protein [Desulfuromusa sp.]